LTIAPVIALFALLGVQFANAQDLSTNGWRLWPDTKASWQSDTLYLPEDVVLTNLPVNPPTGGWGVLNGSQGISVLLPSSVEQYYWAAFGGTAYTGDYSGVAWWWKTFTAPVLQPGQRLIIKFRAARLRAEVYCNQKLCGYNIINEVPFEADVTSAVVPGATTNQLAVRITSPGGNLDWVDYGNMTWGSYSIPLSRGICGLDAGVVLEVRDPVSVSDLAVFNQPNPNQVMVIGAVTNSSTLAYNGPLNLTIQDSNSVALWQATNTISVAAGTQTAFTNIVLVTNATLWDITNPVLYQASAMISANTNSAMNVNFGFRWFTPVGIGTNAMLRLNGRRIVMRSAISWGWWAPNGLFPTDDMARKEVVAAQTLGLNCLNFHRNLGHQNVLDAQDQLGLLRYEEPGNGEAVFGANFSTSVVVPTDLTGNGGAPATFQQKYEADKILAMVKRDRSHPSLVIYNIQNEVNPSLSNPAIFWLFQQIRAIDPSRTVVLHSGITVWNQLLMLPYMTGNNFLYENGSGYSGWADNHTVGGPGTYQDDLYVNPSNYSHISTDTTEIVDWGEMLGVGMPDDHQAIVEWYQTNGVTSTGYDLQAHQLILGAYNSFLDRWNFRSSFPTASSLFYEIGKKSYFLWQKIMENARMCDVNDYLTISGWESTIGDNHSGLMDSHRNFRTDPGILKKAMNPEVLVVRPKRLVLKPGDTASVDVHLINETGRAGAQTLTLTAFNPDGSVLFSQQRTVTATGGDVFGQVLATNFTFVPTTNGVVSVVGSLQPNGGTGDVLTNETDILVIDPLAGAPLMPRIAVCELGSQVKSLLSNTFGITPLGTTNLSDPLDAIVMGFSGAPSWSYTAYNVSSSIANTTDDGLYQKQFFGGAGVVQTWSGFVPGNVTVQLCFAETYWTATNSRLFDVAINGNTVLTNFDIYAQAGGMNTALIKTFNLNAGDGTVSLSFPTVEKDNATIAGIKMTDASNNVVAVAFSTSSFTDQAGLVWQPLSSFPTQTLPVTTAQWQTILNRVSNDGVRLVLLPNTISETMTYANLLAATNLLAIGTLSDVNGNYTGYLPDNTPPWMGSWYFARQHWLLDDLPTDTVLGWQYQIPHIWNTGVGGGMLVNPTAGHPMDVMIGYGRDHEAAVAIGACIIQSGKGQIILPSIPRLRDALSYYDGTFLTQPTALRLFGNSLRAAPASAPLAPPSLTGTPLVGQAVLDWSDAFGAASYNLKRALVSGGPYTVIASNLTSTIYTNTGLANGATYYFVVSGINTNGESSNSTEVAITPLTIILPATTLLNISDFPYSTACAVANYQSVGVSGLTGSETISQFTPAFASGLTSPMTFTNGGQVMYLSSTANGGAYAKDSGAGGSGLLDLYLFTTTSAARTMTVSNLNLLPATTYTLYLIGYIPNNTPAEDGLFTPLNTQHINFASTASGQKLLAVQFTTSASYVNTDTLQFTWARAGTSGDGVFSGLAIVPVPIATNSTNIFFSTSGGMLTLSWPADHTGWKLQSQTNGLGRGLGTNWSDVTGSTLTNSLSLPLNSTNGSVFYRLAYP
jgi:hypothetical protein